MQWYKQLCLNAKIQSSSKAAVKELDGKGTNNVKYSKG